MQRTWEKAIRELSQHAGFSTLVVLTLAFTIGITTAVFSLFDAVLLRPFTYPRPNELVRVRTYKQQTAGTTSGASVYDFWDWQKTNRTFTGLAAYASFHNNLTGTGETQVVRTTAASHELFALLDTQPMLGRSFTRSEDEYHGDVRKLVLSYGLWR